MADQNVIRGAIRDAIRLDGNSKVGFTLCFELGGIDELMQVFEDEDSYGNGPAWEGIAEYLIAHDQQLQEIELDSESDALLAQCAKRAPLKKLQALLRDAATDEHKLRKLIHDARDAGFGHGDL